MLEHEQSAQSLLADFMAGQSDAIKRAHQHLPQLKFGPPEQAAAFPLRLEDARTIIARENGCQSYGELRLAHKLQALELGDALERFKQLVYAQDIEALSALLDAEPKLGATLDDPHFYFGSTALIIVKDNLPLVDLLLKRGADINAKSQWWAGDFHILEVASKETAEQLVQRGAQINAHAAAEQGWLDWLEEAYQREPGIVSRRGGDGKTPLHYATDPAVMDWLLERGADIDARDLDHASTPLQWQLGAHNAQAARELVTRGATVDIFAAVLLGDLGLVEQALDAHPAAINARVNSSGYALAPKADGSHQYVYTFNAANLSPHQVALDGGHDKIFAYLLERSPAEARLLAYCAAGDAEAAHQLAEAQPGIIDGLDDAGRRQLIYAAWSNQLEAVRLMAALGCDLHIVDDDLMTPLHAAAFHGFAEVIAALLEADDEPPLAWLNSYGGTPLGTCLYGWRHGWRDDGDVKASIKLLVEAGSEARREWLPSGDEEVDAILRAGLAAGG